MPTPDSVQDQVPRQPMQPFLLCHLTGEINSHKGQVLQPPVKTNQDLIIHVTGVIKQVITTKMNVLQLIKDVTNVTIMAILEQPVNVSPIPKMPPRSGSGRANAIRAYVETLSPNDAAVFNAGQIEKAEHCGLVYNVEKNDVENPEEMDRHQEFGMFGHLN